MCFRPPTISSERKCESCGEVVFDTSAVVCPQCGAQLPESVVAGAPGAPGAPSAPGAPGAPGVPGAPKAPGAPGTSN